MMLGSLVDEVVRRRLWPVPAAALVVAVAAPLLFMRSAPPDAPAATQAPAPAAPGKLPRKAEVLLAPTDRAVIGHERSKRKAQDPFAPPPGSSSASAKAAASASTAKVAGTRAVAVRIRDAGGSATSSPAAVSSSAKPASSSKRVATTRRRSPKPAVTAPKPASVRSPSPPRATYVDVRFGKRMGTMTRYRVPRLQAFRAGGKVAAMFVGYSRVRNAAVFAIAPSTAVSGVTCRKVAGICRYVDLPAGAYARLRLVGKDGALVSRRLDVVSIRRLPKAPASKASARVTSLPAAKCLLEGLLSLPPSAPSISTDACA